MKRKERAAEDPDGVSSILRQAGAGTRSRKGGQLKAGELHVTRLKDANVASNSKVRTTCFSSVPQTLTCTQSQINSVGFHPEVQVLFTAAQDRRLRLYTVRLAAHVPGRSGVEPGTD